MRSDGLLPLCHGRSLNRPITSCQLPVDWFEDKSNLADCTRVAQSRLPVNYINISTPVFLFMQYYIARGKRGNKPDEKLAVMGMGLANRSIVSRLPCNP